MYLKSYFLSRDRDLQCTSSRNRQTMLSESITYYNPNRCKNDGTRIKPAFFPVHLPPTKVRYGVLQCPLSAYASNIVEVDAVFYFCLTYA